MRRGKLLQPDQGCAHIRIEAAQNLIKRRNLMYRSGERDGVQKIKNFHTAGADFPGRKVVGSLLLGLYDSQGLLYHVGLAIWSCTPESLTAWLSEMPLAFRSKRRHRGYGHQILEAAWKLGYLTTNPMKGWRTLGTMGRMGRTKRKSWC
jgi:hypothetical protein